MVCEKGGKMTIAEYSTGVPRHKMLFETIRIVCKEESDIYYFKDGSFRIYPKEKKQK